jgi:hypothetical protein
MQVRAKAVGAPYGRELFLADSDRSEKLAPMGRSYGPMAAPTSGNYLRTQVHNT